MTHTNPSPITRRLRKPSSFNAPRKTGGLSGDEPPMPGRKVPVCPEAFRKPEKPPGVKR